MKHYNKRKYTDEWRNHHKIFHIRHNFDWNYLTFNCRHHPIRNAERKILKSIGHYVIGHVGHEINNNGSSDRIGKRRSSWHPQHHPVLPSMSIFLKKWIRNWDHICFLPIVLTDISINFCSLLIDLLSIV
jgi:hypothetical protein